MKLLKRMMHEEWRMHTRLFSGRAFAVFPVLIFILSGLTYLFLSALSVPTRITLIGIQAMAFFLGVNVGSIGFVGRDALDNLLGETNLLIFSSRTLPISQRRILATFLVKDLLYYAGLFILPTVLAVVAILPPTQYGVVSVLFATTIGMFMLGVTLSLFLAALYVRGTRYVVLALVLGGGVLFLQWEAAQMFTALAFFQSPSIPAAARALLPLLVFSVLGIALFTPATYQPARTYRNTFERVHARLRVPDPALTAKAVTDMFRSSGGVVKLVFAPAVIVAVFVVMARYLPVVDTFLAAPGASFAVLLSVGAMATYNWLTRFDDPGLYWLLPISVGNVYRSKWTAYLLFSLPISYVFLFGASAVYGTTGLLVGVIALPLLTVFIGGFTIYLTGMEPDAMLLNGKLFAGFMLGVSAVFVPAFVLTLLYPEYPVAAGVALLLESLIAALIGVILFRRGVARWTSRTRR